MTGWLVKLHMHHAEDFDVFECEILRPRQRGGVGPLSVGPVGVTQVRV